MKFLDIIQLDFFEKTQNLFKIMFQILFKNVIKVLTHVKSSLPHVKSSLSHVKCSLPHVEKYIKNELTNTRKETKIGLLTHVGLRIWKMSLLTHVKLIN